MYFNMIHNLDFSYYNIDLEIKITIDNIKDFRVEFFLKIQGRYLSYASVTGS